MIYHKFRFGLFGNFNVLLCRIFGHRINNHPKYETCERCGLAYSECYYPLDYYGIKRKEFKKSEEDFENDWADFLDANAMRTEYIKHLKQ